MLNLALNLMSKGEVEATIVYSKISIVEPPLIKVGFSAFANATHTYRSDLDVDPKEITGGLPKRSHPPIQVGDKVIQIAL